FVVVCCCGLCFGVCWCVFVCFFVWVVLLGVFGLGVLGWVVVVVVVGVSFFGGLGVVFVAVVFWVVVVFWLVLGCVFVLCLLVCWVWWGGVGVRCAGAFDFGSG
ncbi:hypothetical protein RA279_27965, partial [Pseudomonas syringae pv. tagetis]|uniref:hypothetical protein n=1 Tax=Pseudomonas syringae group genomosp. 7 TaxID=251699 RepID=UPI0037705A74